MKVDTPPASERHWSDIDGALFIGWPDAASRNAIGAAAAQRMTAQLARAQGSGVRVVVLGADQSPFCSGWDVRDLADLDTSTREGVVRYFEAGRDLLRALEACPMPVVGVVRGVALGFGCSLLAHCDVVIADAEAQFGLPEINRGFAPATVMPELLGAMDAREIRAWALTGGKRDAQRAAQAGLVHVVAPSGRLEASSADLVAGLAGVDEPALRQTKGLLRELSALDLPERRARGVAAAVDHFCKGGESG